MTVSLFPFGNAIETRLRNGTYVYTCQHGPKECQANIFEACIIKQNNFESKAYMPTLTCIEYMIHANKNPNAQKPIENIVFTCVKLFQPTKSYQWIKKCEMVK